MTGSFLFIKIPALHQSWRKKENLIKDRRQAEILMTQEIYKKKVWGGYKPKIPSQSPVTAKLATVVWKL